MLSVTVLNSEVLHRQNSVGKRLYWKILYWKEHSLMHITCTVGARLSEISIVTEALIKADRQMGGIFFRAPSKRRAFSTKSSCITKL